MELRDLDARQLDVWRKKYLDQLGLPVIPDLHEALCRVGKAFAVEEAGRRFGYVIYSAETFWPGISPVIPEFYFELETSKTAKLLLRAVLDKLRPKTLIGRTDDRAGFPLLMDLHLPNDLAAPLYQLETPPPWVENKEWTLVQSGLEDTERLRAIYAEASPEDGGIADERTLAKSLAVWRHYRLMVDGEIVAVAYVAPQHGKYITVPTIVPAAWRRKGYGRYLAAMAVRRELSEGKVYVATVNAENEAARGLVESLGARLSAYFIHFRPPEGGEALPEA